MNLALPLSQHQVDSAGRVYQALRQWRLADSTLEMLAVRLPGFSAEECLLKTVAANSIYGTQLLATLRMANHIRGILNDPRTTTTDTSLVERIARLPAEQGEKPRLMTSFASKFCHFFVNAEVFPMYDEAARDALKLHLGDGYIVDGKQPYVAFCQNLCRVRELANLGCKTKELDQYLWLTGMVMRWQKERTKKTQRIGAELKAVLEHPSPEITAELKRVLPEQLAALIGWQGPTR